MHLIHIILLLFLTRRLLYEEGYVYISVDRRYRTNEII